MVRRRAARPGPAAVPGRSEDGIAMVTTVIAMVVLVSLSLVVLDRSVESQKAARTDQDWNAAYAAAQAGVDDYVQRLNNTNGSYYVYNTTNPDSGNQAMGTTSGQPKWAGVPQVGTGTARASFHYDIDTTYYTGSGSVTPNGTIKISSTGKVGDRTRTVKALVRRSGFMDHMYFTDFETMDPTLYDSGSLAWAASNCADKYWDARPASAARSSSCTNIQFANDTLDGPVYSNDTIMICDNVTFRKQVTTAFGGNSSTSFRKYRTNGCSSTSGTTFAPAAPLTVAAITMPLTNKSLRAYTQASASPRGCLYVGPTKILLKGTTMYVDSPWTKPSSLPSICGLKTWKAIPTAGVVYVDDVPSFDTSDPNSWASSDSSKPSCPSNDPTKNNLGYPLTNIGGYNESGWTYQCKAGDVFIQEQNGTSLTPGSGSLSNALDGRLTVGASNDVYVTGNIDYSGGTSGQSLLGLIADGFVYFAHPTRSGTTNLGTNMYPSRVAASMISVDHSIMTQSYDIGADLGALSVTGSMAQKYRGIVRQGSSGYSKNYLYDPRLVYDAPPHFLEPTTSSFNSASVQEIKPAY